MGKLRGPVSVHPRPEHDLGLLLPEVSQIAPSLTPNLTTALLPDSTAFEIPDDEFAGHQYHALRGRMPVLRDRGVGRDA